MRKFFLVVLPLAAMFLVIGCEQGSQASARPAPSSSTTAPAATQAAAPAPAPQQQYRASTTQPLPAGWGYIHEQDLAGGNAATGSDS